MAVSFLNLNYSVSTKCRECGFIMTSVSEKSFYIIKIIPGPFAKWEVGLDRDGGTSFMEGFGWSSDKKKACLSGQLRQSALAENLGRHFWPTVLADGFHDGTDFDAVTRFIIDPKYDRYNLIHLF